MKIKKIITKIINNNKIFNYRNLIINIIINIIMLCYITQILKQGDYELFLLTLVTMIELVIGIYIITDELKSENFKKTLLYTRIQTIFMIIIIIIKEVLK